MSLRCKGLNTTNVQIQSEVIVLSASEHYSLVISSKYIILSPLLCPEAACHKETPLIGFKLSFGAVEVQLHRQFPRATRYQRPQLAIPRMSSCVVSKQCHGLLGGQKHWSIHSIVLHLLSFSDMRSLSMGDGSFPALQLGGGIIAPSQHVRVLGVIFSADLSLEKHVSNVSETCFYHLRRLRHIRRSLIRSLPRRSCTPL